MNKICVYTCITGNYDNLKDIKFKEKNIDYICFTNNKSIKSNTWKVIYINEDLDNLLLARKVKILGYKYLKDYDVLVWMDGAINILQPISNFMKNCCDLDKYDIIGFKHKYRDCIYDEINECVRVNKESIKNAQELEKFLEKEKYPKHNGLIESTVLVRKNNKEVNRLMDRWFDMLVNYSKRDQLSFNYVLWKNPVKIKFLNMWVYKNPYFLHDQHEDLNKIKKYRLYFGNSSEFDYHKCLDGEYTIDSLKEGIKFKLPCDANRIELTIDEMGNNVKSVSLNKKNKMFIYNICEIKNKKVFYDISVISFEGTFKKDDELVFKVNIEELNYLEKLKLIYDGYLEVNKISESYTTVVNVSDILRKENDDLKKLNKELSDELQKMINSRGWKFLNFFRNIKNKLLGRENKK